MTPQPALQDAPRLEHLLLEVSQLDQTLAFWAILAPGWGVRWDGRPEGEPWIHLGPEGEGRPPYLSLWARGAVASPGRGGLRVRHLGFAVEALEPLLARAAAAGLVPHELVVEGRHRRAYFQDPDGHELEFVEELQAPGGA